MANPETIGSRLRALLAAAPSQAAVARAARVSEGTLINWSRDLGVRESKLLEVAGNLGVSVDWLRDGRGDEDREIDHFLAKLKSQTRIAEEPAYYGSPRERLREALDRADLTPAQLARQIGYDSGVIFHVVRGTGRMSEAMAEKIVAALNHGLTKADLMDGSDEPPVLDESGREGTHGARPKIVLPPGMSGRMVPLLSMAQAGGWDAGHTDEGWTGKSVFALNVEDRQAFAIQVSGNSMEPEIMEGDVVICSPREPLTPGCCAVVRTKSEQAFVKFWRQRGQRVILESANPDYQPIQLPVAEIAGAWPVVQRIASGKITKQLP